MSIVSKFNSIKSVKRHFKISYFLIFLEYVSNRDKGLKVSETKDGVSLSITLGRMAQLSRLLDNGWKTIDSTDKLVKIKGPKNEILHCRTQVGADIDHIDEIFLRKVYGADFQGKNVIDIGMSNGDSSIFFCKKWCKTSDRC